MRGRFSFFSVLVGFIGVLILLVLLFVFGYWTSNFTKKWESRLNYFENIYVQKNRYFAQSAVDSFIYYINTKKSEILRDFEYNVKKEDLAWKIASYNFDLGKLKNFSKKRIISSIVDKLRVASDINEFVKYTVVDKRAFDLVFSVKLPPRLANIILSAKDRTFVKCRWVNGERVTVYVRKFRPLNLTLLTIINDTKLDSYLKKSWLLTMGNYRYGEKREGYIVVYEFSGNSGCSLRVVANSLNEAEVGKCLSFSQAFGGNMKSVFKILEKKGYLFFANSKRILFFRYYRPWKWFIGSGILIEDVQSLLREQRYMAVKQFNRSVGNLIEFLFFVGVVAIFASFMFVYAVKNRTYRIVKLLDDSLKGDRSVLSREKPVFREFDLLIRYFSEALDRIAEYENDFLKAFVSILEARDIYTKGHSQRVAFYSKRIAEKLGYDETKQEEIYRAGLLHDVGKVGIPDAVLLKPGKLTDNEYRIMKQHPVISYEILVRSKRFNHLARWVRQHHEKCDGSGYPDGLMCDEITYEAKIIEIADIFDALTTTRPYRKAFSTQRAIEILKEEKVDKDILLNVLDVLVKAKDEVGEVEVEFMSKQLDEIRNEFFNYDFMTGLRVWMSLKKTLQEFVDVGTSFVLYKINIKNISQINYRFGDDIGDEVIVKTADALKRYNGNSGFEDLICRAYADIFFMARRTKNTELLPVFEEEASTIRSYLMESVFSGLFDDRRIDRKCLEGIEDYLDFDVHFVRYPSDGNTLNEVIYKLETLGKIG